MKTFDQCKGELEDAKELFDDGLLDDAGYIVGAEVPTAAAVDLGARRAAARKHSTHNCAAGRKQAPHTRPTILERVWM